MKRKYIILSLVVIVFGAIIFISTKDVKKESIIEPEEEILGTAKLDYHSELDNYRDNALRNKMKLQFEELFNVDMTGFEYVEITEVFPEDITTDSTNNTLEVGDYYPLGFIKDNKAYILILKNNGQSKLWKLQKENETWIVDNKQEKQGSYIDLDIFYEEIEKKFFEDNPGYDEGLNS